MPTDLGPILTEPTPTGLRYILPRRALGSGRYGGLVFAGIGLFVTAFMCLWMGLPIYHGVQMLRKGEWFGLLLVGFGLLGLPGLGFGLMMLGAGLGIYFNLIRAEIELRHDRLISIERVGPFRWKRSRSLDHIQQFRLTPALSGKSRRSLRNSPQEVTDLFDQAASGSELRLMAIQISGEKIKPLKFAGGFPVDLLRPLATDLSERISQTDRTRLIGGSTNLPVIVDDAPLTPEAQSQRDLDELKESLIQPASSKVTLDRRDDGLTLSVPPMGLRKGSSGLFAFGLIWTLFTGGIMTAILVGTIRGDNSDIDSLGEALGIGALALVFISVGVGMMIAGIHMGKRRVVIDVVAQTLLITQVSPIRKRQSEWPASQIERIEMGPSGMEVNDRPIMCLLVEPRNARATKWLTGRDEAELQWLAATLEHELHLNPAC